MCLTEVICLLSFGFISPSTPQSFEMRTSIFADFRLGRPPAPPSPTSQILRARSSASPPPSPTSQTLHVRYSDSDLGPLLAEFSVPDRDRFSAPPPPSPTSQILRARSSNSDRDQRSGVQVEGMVSSIHSSPSETNVLQFCMSMGLAIGTNMTFLQLKRNSFDEVLTCIEILMFFIGLMIFILRHAIMSSTYSPRRIRDVLSWILDWIPYTCAPLVAIPMISFCIAIGEAIKITILIIGYIVLVATNFSRLRSDVMRLFLHPVDRTQNAAGHLAV